jgi:hypothetical protein
MKMVSEGNKLGDYRMTKKRSNESRLEMIINAAIKRLDEHWVYDIAELFTDCAVATHRIANLLRELQEKPDQIRDQVALEAALDDFADFEQKCGSMAKKRLDGGFPSPDEVEWHLERIRIAGLSVRRRTQLEKRDSDEDFCRSFETVQQIRNPS